MNVAFYINQINKDEKTVAIFNGLNADIESGAIDNGSVFYKEIGQNPVEPKFGKKGITFSDEFFDAIKAVNKYSLVYLFDGSKRHDVFSLIGMSKATKILTTTEEDQKEVYRLTGFKPILLENVNPSTVQKALG